MKFFSNIFLYISFYCCQGQSIDNGVYICKYTFLKQKDSTNKKSVVKDIMCLSIKNDQSIYYSYLFQLGRRKAEEDKGKSLEYTMTQQQLGSYNPESEKEIMFHYNGSKKTKVMIMFKNIYCYTEDIIPPNWKIYPEIITILNQQCQKATTFYKGRNYTAWFALSIPYRLGPWEFVGLPGLILRISDTQDQFVFECTELLKQESDGIYKEYPNCKDATRKRIEELKKLFVTDMQAYDQIEWGVTWSIKNTDGTSIPVKRTINPYNPIDLSNKY